MSPESSPRPNLDYIKKTMQPKEIENAAAAAEHLRTKKALAEGKKPSEALREGAKAGQETLSEGQKLIDARKTPADRIKELALTPEQIAADEAATRERLSATEAQRFLKEIEEEGAGDTEATARRLQQQDVTQTATPPQTTQHSQRTSTPKVGFFDKVFKTKRYWDSQTANIEQTTQAGAGEELTIAQKELAVAEQRKQAKHEPTMAAFEASLDVENSRASKTAEKTEAKEAAEIAQVEKDTKEFEQNIAAVDAQYAKDVAAYKAQTTPESSKWTKPAQEVIERTSPEPKQSTGFFTKIKGLFKRPTLEQTEARETKKAKEYAERAGYNDIAETGIAPDKSMPRKAVESVGEGLHHTFNAVEDAAYTGRTLEVGPMQQSDMPQHELNRITDEIYNSGAIKTSSLEQRAAKAELKQNKKWEKDIAKAMKQSDEKTLSSDVITALALQQEQALINQYGKDVKNWPQASADSDVAKLYYLINRADQERQGEQGLAPGNTRTRATSPVRQSHRKRVSPSGNEYKGRIG